MIIKDFQPIHLRYCSDDDSTCNCGKRGCDQKALITDKVSLQVGDIEYFATEELLVEAGDGSYYGDFHDNAAFLADWANDAGGNVDWTWNAAGYAQVVLLVGEVSEILHTVDTFTFEACHMYRICFDITPDYGEDCDFLVYLREAGVGVTLIKTYEGPEAGTYCFTYQPTATVVRQLGFMVDGDCEGTESVTYTLDNVTLKEIEPNVKIYNCCDDSLVDTVEICDITGGDDYFNIEFNWDDYVSDEACYKICLDDVELILNGGFDFDLQNWIQSGPTDVAFTWVAGEASVDLTFGQSSRLISQGTQEGNEFGLPANCLYPLTFDVNVLNAGYTDWRLDLYVNGLVVQSYTAPGTLTYNIQLNTVFNSVGFKIIDLRLAGGAETIRIDNVSIEVDICSDCLCVKESHNCTHLVKGWNDEDTESFAFPGTFAFYMRMASKFRNWRYPTDEEIYESSHGVSSLNYRKSDKIWDYQMDRMPEYMWDAITTLFGVDNLEIDGTKYIKIAGDIEPIHSRSNDKQADGSVEVKKKTENRVK